MIVETRFNNRNLMKDMKLQRETENFGENQEIKNYI